MDRVLQIRVGITVTVGARLENAELTEIIRVILQSTRKMTQYPYRIFALTRVTIGLNWSAE